MNRCLGRTPSPYDPRTLQYETFLKADPRAFPASRRWGTPISDWGVMGNNQYGNCTIVTPAHCILTWRANELQDTRRITDSAVIELSRSMGALNGFNILTRLKYWRKTGMWGNYLWAYAAIPPTNVDMIKHAVDAFGCVDIGVNMPSAWRNQDFWDTGAGRQYAPGSWGGHSVPIVGYDSDNCYVATWGQEIPCTWDALERYCDEAYSLINPDWLAGDSVSPSGFDLIRLHHALRNLTGTAFSIPATYHG